MRAMMETGFDAVYLILVLTLGVKMVTWKNAPAQFRLFGVMAIVLGAGDAFHLVPRAVVLCTTGLENFVTALGMGKWITSVTMTVFYVLLYYVWRLRYRVQGGNGWTVLVWALAAVRIVLCMMPQNEWLSANPPLSWGIYRNLPFAALGLVVLVLFYRSARRTNDRAFRWMWLTIVLSFGFYIPVVLWADAASWVGMLMIPKTCAYVWTVLIGYRALRREGTAVSYTHLIDPAADFFPVYADNITIYIDGCFFQCFGQVEPVSYTHLDVYKRQVLQWSLKKSLRK